MLASTDSLPPSRQRKSVINNVFRALESAFPSNSMQIPSLCALRLATRFSGRGAASASYGLFKTIMTFDTLTDQHWEAARLAIYAAFRHWCPGEVGEPKEILRFLDHHVRLEGEGGDYGSYIMPATGGIVELQATHGINPLSLGCVREFNWASPSFVRGVCSIMQPHSSIELRGNIVCLIALVSDGWFDRSASVMGSEDMLEFCENFAKYTSVVAHGPGVKQESVTLVFGMLRSTDWRVHMVPRLWGALAYSALVEELESFRWCLRNAIELLDFTRGLSDGEGLKWWFGTLWLHFDKLDSTTRDEVKRIAAGMRSDGLSDLNFCLGLIKGEISRVQQQVNEPRDEVEEEMLGLNLRTRLIAMEWNYQQLTQVIAGR